MSVDTTGFVPNANGGDRLETLRVIRDALVPFAKKNRMGGPGRVSIELDWIGDDTCARAIFPAGVTEPGSATHRMVHIHFDIDSDYSETCAGPKLILSCGCWGDADQFIPAALEAVCRAQGIEHFYFCRNDSTDEFARHEIERAA